jgi:hypothetical protein
VIELEARRREETDDRDCPAPQEDRAESSFFSLRPRVVPQLADRKAGPGKRPAPSTRK